MNGAGALSNEKRPPSFHQGGTRGLLEVGDHKLVGFRIFDHKMIVQTS
jgi:hypothetical protein